MRVLVLGGNGQVGHSLTSAGSFSDMTAVTRQDCDLTDAASLRALVRRIQPQAIVNAAAYTAVDHAESDRDTCYAVNAVAPGVLAEEARALGAKLVHYSTDYVFDGAKPSPYVESDPTGPRNVYGASKLAGEAAIAAAGGEWLVLRTSWIYSNHGSNFMKTMLRLGAERRKLCIVADQRGAPTSAEAIAAATVALLQRAADGQWTSGVFHMTAAGTTTWHGFAAAIFARAEGQAPELVPITTAEYPTPTARPANSVLSNDRFAAAFGFRLPHWEQQLDSVMTARRAEVHADT